MKRAILLLTLIAAPILLSPACSPPEFLKGNQREVTVHLMRCEKDLQYGAMFRRRGCEGSYIPAQVFHYKLFLNEQIVVSKAIPTAWKKTAASTTRTTGTASTAMAQTSVWTSASSTPPGWRPPAPGERNMST